MPLACGDMHLFILLRQLANPSAPSPADLGRDPLVTGKQVVEIRHTLKDPRTLGDPVRTAGHTTELRVRDMSWRRANGESRSERQNPEPPASGTLLKTFTEHQGIGGNEHRSSKDVPNPISSCN